MGQGRSRITPFSNYDRYLTEFDAKTTSNARLLHERLSVARQNVPGFAGVETAALQYVQNITAEPDLMTSDAHFLRQPGSSFGPHRDRHVQGLRYSLVVKLTDGPYQAIQDASFSRMHILEQEGYSKISFGRKAGASVLFRSQDKHTSLATPAAFSDDSGENVYKVSHCFELSTHARTQTHTHPRVHTNMHTHT